MGLVTIGTTGTCLLASFQVMADEKDFFHGSFITTKDPDAIVDFYSTEDFLQILGVVPLGIQLILAGVEWDNKSENTMDVWNTMRISFDITEKEEPIGPDGENVVTFFNKRERFVQYIPFTKILLWDQVQNYGYRRLKNGTMEVSHDGESFYGPWPVRLAVGLHAKYVVWATEKHINSPIFGTKDLEAQEHQRSNIPLHVATEWLAELRSSQEKSIQTAKAAGQNTTEQEATLKTLKKLQRHNTILSVEEKPGNQILSGTVKVHAEDPEAQKAIRSALKSIKTINGDEAAAATLSSLLNKAEVRADPSSPQKRAELARRKSMVA